MYNNSQSPIMVISGKKSGENVKQIRETYCGSYKDNR